MTAALLVLLGRSHGVSLLSLFFVIQGVEIDVGKVVLIQLNHGLYHRHLPPLEYLRLFLRVGDGHGLSLIHI